ncbi:MAG: ATP-dependent DNA helicase RecG [Chloroflexi bacterium]|nr:ATP-dependent DNA helicase RecG [Chloroflexota bacterium]
MTRRQGGRRSPDLPAVLPDDPLDLDLTSMGVARGPAARLRRIGIRRVRDLLFHLPRRYDDFSHTTTLRELREHPPDGPASTVATIIDLRVDAGFRRRVQRTVARLQDETGEGEAVWFGRRFIERRLQVGMTVAVAGKVDVKGFLPRFTSPEFGAADADSLHAGRIVPVYRLTAGVTAPWLRKTMREMLDAHGSAYPEYQPPGLGADVDGEPLLGIAEAIEAVHYPPDFASRDAALRRLAFDELLALQVGMVARDRQRRSAVAAPLTVADARYAEAVAAIERRLTLTVQARLARSSDPASRADAATLEVALTADQQRALQAIRTDLAGERPMLRLLQGDVGSGKTAVAALALAFAADAGRQGALLAPTDLLARQHAATLSGFLEPLGHAITLLTGSLAAAERRSALEMIAAPGLTMPGAPTAGRVVVGTHALVQQGVSFDDLAIAVIDEQHRFGVAQREALDAKGRSPHVLLMTATPIPQTLARIVHADLDVSDLRTPPAGRLVIRTGVRSTDDLMQYRGDPGRGTWPLVAREIEAGHRAFVVVPLVEDDEEAGAASVGQMADEVRRALPLAAATIQLPEREYRTGILHGQLKAADRDLVMDAFRRGELDVLVGTTVLEVGVDVPEATVMVIVDAERFGVAQLHQLRGRVGRGEAASFCVLVSHRYPHDQPKERDSDEQAAVRARLDAVASNNDGFMLAELDLEQRREGQLLGLSQSGLPPFRVASLSSRQDLERSLRARALAERLVDDGGRLIPGTERLAAELDHGWLARVGAGEVLAAGEEGTTGGG